MNRPVPFILLISFFIVIVECARKPPELQGDLPIDERAVTQLEEVDYYSIRNIIALEDLLNAIANGSKGLSLDLGNIRTLLDGTRINPSRIYGYTWIGPYPFEALETRFDYKRFRRRDTIERGSATIDVGYFLSQSRNSEDWENEGVIMLRLELRYKRFGIDRSLGTYDIPVAFRKTESGFLRLPWIIEGPLVNLIRSEMPHSAVITCITDQVTSPVLTINEIRKISSTPGKEHIFEVNDLMPNTAYTYSIRVGDLATPTYTFQTAPEKGSIPVRIAYCGDTREGQGSDLHQFMGVNAATLESHVARAYSLGCELFIMGGDLINGYTTSASDFLMQLYAWKQTMSGFWHERPVYPIMGNHEALVKAFDVGEKRPMQIDRWPYDTQSAEAAFADAFVNPTNGPEPSDIRRPRYDENVFSFTYGAVRIIGLNNNYWVSSEPLRYGGCPEGYLMDDQLSWIQSELTIAENDPLIRYIMIYAQEPVFPCGGHITDAMWYSGDNSVRAAVFSEGMLIPEPKGIIDIRNEFIRMVHSSHKVVVVLCSDEHAYYRVLIDNRVPIGDPDLDDADSDSIINWQKNETASPLHDLAFPVWYITCGGGGAPYYAEQPAPWNQYWLEKPDAENFYRYSSQENFVVFDADSTGVEMTVYNVFGEVLDHIPDLMEVKE